MGNNDTAKMHILYEGLIERFVAWAETRSDIKGAIIVGSRARVDHPADEWADLDVILITTDPERYVSRSDWISNFGNPLLTFLEPTSTGGEMERRVLFEGMLDVDFAIIPEGKAQQLMKEAVSPQMAAQISNVFGRGIRVLLDKDGMIAQLKTLISSIETPSPSPPTQHEFLEVVSDFLYHAVFTAKHLRRGELWWTVSCLDCYMQHLLLRIIEWHALATHDWKYDIWFRGRFLEEWAHPQAAKGLHEALAHYDMEDVKRALLAAMDLFHWLATETAAQLSYPYPAEAFEIVKRWIKKCILETDKGRQ